MNNKIRPFSCGSQYGDWICSNCERCTKGGANRERLDCDIAQALLEACFGDGSVSADIARRMGYGAGSLRYVWPCGEVEWTEEWKAQCRKDAADLKRFETGRTETTA